MRILVVGAGGVGEAAALIAARRNFFELWVVSDYDKTRADDVVAKVADERFISTRIDASNAGEVTELCLKHSITHVLNAVDPRFVMPIFDGALLPGRITWIPQ